MKHISLLALFLIALIMRLPAQNSQFKKIKTVVRNSKGQLVQNTNVNVKFDVLEKSANGAVIYTEVHEAKTDAKGEAEFIIGTGKTLYGNQAALKRGHGKLFLKTYIDLNGGVSFMEMETERKTTLPYALYAGYVSLNAAEEPVAEIVETADENAIIDFDGNVYTSVNIGTQTWLAENIKSAHYADGTLINGAFDYENNVTLSDEYGKLYTWNAAMNNAPGNNLKSSGVQGVCPTGYHIPSEAEWQKMANHVNALKSLGGKQLKESGNEHWETANGTNTTKFGARGAGFLQKEGGRYGNLNKQTYFWSTSVVSPTNAKIFLIYDNGSATLNHNMNKTSGRSVRCVKD